jgi:hypothetical protein
MIYFYYYNFFLCRETVMRPRKSMLGKRKNIPQPVPVLPPVSTRKRGLGTGKETSYASFKNEVES